MVAGVHLAEADDHVNPRAGDVKTEHALRMAMETAATGRERGNIRRGR